MQRFCIIAILDQFVSHLLRLYLCTTEDDSKDAGIIVHDTLQCQVLVFGIHHVIDMVHVFGTFITRANHNLFIVVQVSLGNTFYLLAHRRREEQCVTVLRNTLQNGIDTLRETHIQHLVSLIQYDVIDIVQLSYTSVHQVDESSWGGYNNLGTLAQGTNLLLDRGTTVNRLHMDVVHVFREVAQVVSNLQTELAGGRQNQCLCLFATGINTLQYGYAKCCRLTRTRLGQGNDVISVS